MKEDVALYFVIREKDGSVHFFLTILTNNPVIATKNMKKVIESLGLKLGEVGLISDINKI